MSVIRFEPFRDPFREFDRLMSMAASGTRAPLGMPMDVYRGQDGGYHVEADLPGVDPDRVEVTVEHSVLTIQAERAPHYGEGDQVIAAERPQGSFTRQLSLGEGVDAARLTAGYADGVLHVTIPASPKAQARRVEITHAAGGGRTISGSTAEQARPPWRHQWGRRLNRLRTPQQCSAVAETPARGPRPGAALPAPCAARHTDRQAPRILAPNGAAAPGGFGAGCGRAVLAG